MRIKSFAFLFGSLIVSGFAGFSTAQPVALPKLPILTAAEWEWIVQNPTVRVAVEADWKPISYLSNGRFHGLTSAYLKEISRKTGLHFELVSTTREDVAHRLVNKQVDVLPSTLRVLSTEEEITNTVIFTRPYYVGSSVVITRENGNVIYSLSELSGKRIALKKGSEYHVMLKKPGQNVELFDTPTSEDALIAVLQNRADAALGIDAALLPYLRRKYASLLHVSGVISGLRGDLVMGVRKDLPLLHSILNKSLASLTARESDVIDEEWLSHSDYGMPSVDVVLHFYGVELAMVACVILIMAGFACRAHLDRRKALESELQKTMFLAVMSHEIRSPMHAVLGSIELLQSTDLDMQQNRLSNLAISGAKSLLRLLDEVLDVSKLEAGKLTLDLSGDNIVEVIRQTINLQQIHAQTKGISLTFEAKSDIPSSLLIDASRVTQITHNLISNSIKFTNKGSVSVSIVLNKVHSLNGVLNQGVERWLQLTVSDTGVGIAPEQQAKLFKPYAQADKSTSRLYGGTGLGLTICRELVTLMGGNISLVSELNSGTTVIVQWPVTIASKGSQTNQVNVHPLRKFQIGAKVLLVEDTPVNAAVISAQLDELGCEAIVAESGEQAMHILNKEPVDLILMDCDLPIMDGYETTRRWRTIENSKNIGHIPILAVSASADAQHTERCFLAGMDGSLKKPLMLEKLRDAIDIWCDFSPIRANTAISQAHLPSTRISPSLELNVFEEDARAIKVSIESGNKDKVIHHTHRLVGAALTLNNEQLANAAQTLESHLRDGKSLKSVEIVEAYNELIRFALNVT